MFWICVFLLAVSNLISDIEGNHVKFKAVVENATECPRPQPPFAKKRTWLSTLILRKHKDRMLLSGTHKVLAELPFVNGIYGYTDVDFDKQLHSVPAWHPAGRFIHRSSFVYNGSTVMCVELTIWTHFL